MLKYFSHVLCFIIWWCSPATPSSPCRFGWRIHRYWKWVCGPRIWSLFRYSSLQAGKNSPGSSGCKNQSLRIPSASPFPARFPYLRIVRLAAWPGHWVFHYSVLPDSRHQYGRQFQLHGLGNSYCQLTDEIMCLISPRLVQGTKCAH